MAEKQDDPLTTDAAGKLGIVPDFFHDILAHIVPGYTALILVVCDCYIGGVFTCPSNAIKVVAELPAIAQTTIVFASLITAYVLGRFFEELGMLTVHRWNPSPKFSLLFGEQPHSGSEGQTDTHRNERAKDTRYTAKFAEGVRDRIEDWLSSRKFEGESLMAECMTNRKDDYFNLLRNYLRSKSPSTALFEKKQNALIAMTRSLSLIFLVNVVVYWVVVASVYFSGEKLAFSFSATVWLVANLLISPIFYRRFRRDQSYYAEYIFEEFMSNL